MAVDDIQDAVREVNLSLLMLAQQMIFSDRVAAIFRLGITEGLADLIEGMSTAQIIRLAACDSVLPGLRIDHPSTLSLLASDSKPPRLARWHTAILLAGQAAEGCD